MKVVLDTNVLISAHMFGGKPRIIFELIVVEQKIEGITSPVLLDEYYRILREKFDFDKNMLKRVDKVMRDYFTIVAPKTVPSLLTDEPDNNVLAVTDATPIEAIITGDKVMLDLKEFHGSQIITPDTCLTKHNFDTAEENRFYNDLLNH